MKNRLTIAGFIEKLTGKKKKSLADVVPYDPKKQIPIIRCSICTGEQAAGFKSKENGHFTEVLLIKTEEDLEYFKESYHLDSITKEY